MLGLHSNYRIEVLNTCLYYLYELSFAMQILPIISICPGTSLDLSGLDLTYDILCCEAGYCVRLKLIGKLETRFVT